MDHSKEINSLRSEIDKLDYKIALLLLERISFSLEIGKLKREDNLSPYSPEREREIKDKIRSVVADSEFKEYVIKIFERILDESRSIQIRKKSEQKRENTL